MNTSSFSNLYMITGIYNLLIIIALVTLEIVSFFTALFSKKSKIIDDDNLKWFLEHICGRECILCPMCVVSGTLGVISAVYFATYFATQQYAKLLSVEIVFAIIAIFCSLRLAFSGYESQRQREYL